MIEYIFRPSRRDKATGNRVRADYYSGRYALTKGGRSVSVSLNTPDKEIARKRLREIVLLKQRELEGIIPSSSIRQTASTPLPALVDNYEQDLKGRDLDPKHIHDTVTRLRRMLSENSWRYCGDVRPDAFVRWRASLRCSAKTKKEYQTSACAFFNWLLNTDCITSNPLGRIDMIEIRGKQVRESRSFTEEELQRLFNMAGYRLPAYLLLLYTGQRKEEVRSLVWDDLHLDGPRPYILFRASTTKDKDKRAVPLHPQLAALLQSLRPKACNPTAKVFDRCFPVYDTLRLDLEKAKIPHKDSLGRVVHFHSFRKTWQTLGVRYGVNQRAAQEVLGHSDANLTARAYTDVPALALHSEIEKFPWIPGGEVYAQPDAQKFGVSWHSVALPGISAQIGQILQTVKSTAVEEIRHFLAKRRNPGPYWTRTSDLFHVKEAL